MGNCLQEDAVPAAAANNNNDRNSSKNKERNNKQKEQTESNRYKQNIYWAHLSPIPRSE